MGSTDTALIDSAIWSVNVSALRGVDPDLADQLADDLILAGVHPEIAETADGRVNYRVNDDDGRRVWFGRTSIPRVRAKALIDCFEPGAANVLLPGIGEGSEASLLLDRLASHRAIFVWEPSPANLRLALSLHDMGNALAEGRLVLWACSAEALEVTMLRWFDDHPGHLCPNRLLAWPWHEPSELEPWRWIVSRVHTEVDQRRRRRLTEARQEVGRSNSTGGLAIMSLAAQPDLWALGDALQNACVHERRQARCIDVRTPADMHPLALQQRLVAARPDHVVLLDSYRQQYAGILPGDLSAVSWLGPASPVCESGAPNSDDVAFTTHRRLVSSLRLEEAVARVEVCPRPCLAPLDEPPRQDGRDIDALVLTECPPLDVSQFEPSLPTIAEIWRRAMAKLERQIIGFADDHTESLLVEAERQAGGTIDDAGARQELIGVLSRRVGGSMLATACAQALSKGDRHVVIAGPGWHDAGGGICGASPWTLAERLDLCRRAKCVVLADVIGLSAELALLAAGSGAVVLAHDHPAHEEPGGLATLLVPGRQEMIVFGSPAALSESVEGLIADETARVALAERAWERCRLDHAPGARIRALGVCASP